MASADPVGAASGDTAPLVVTIAHSPRAGSVTLARLEMPASACVRDALRTAAASVPGWPPGDGRPPEGWTLAVWGRRCGPDRPLRDGDRVELLRPLTCDPKESRRLRYRRTPGRQGGIERGRARAAKEGELPGP
jgi:putative ubiquitin-RnfH superfamily antitoxin RatB of RatAB toxin-antitoxin module